MKISQMQPMGFNVLFINNYPKDPDGKIELLPTSFAMHWCMNATYMSRLFSREDMHEFLFRLAITLDTLGIIENWFAYDKILSFPLNGLSYTLRAKDILFHYGFEIFDSTENCQTREFYLDNVSNGINAAMFVGCFGGSQLLAPQKVGANKFDFSLNEHAPKVTEKLIQDAEFFANDILKLVPDEFFEQTNNYKEKKLVEIQDRIAKIAALPIFDITKIPKEVIHECIGMMYEAQSAKEILAIPEDFETFGKPLIKLAWLWANDMMVIDEGGAFGVEGVDLDISDYDYDGGINLLETFENHNLEECLPLLKGVGM